MILYLISAFVAWWTCKQGQRSGAACLYKTSLNLQTWENAYLKTLPEPWYSLVQKYSNPHLHFIQRALATPNLINKTRNLCYNITINKTLVPIYKIMHITDICNISITHPGWWCHEQKIKSSLIFVYWRNLLNTVEFCLCSTCPTRVLSLHTALHKFCKSFELDISFPFQERCKVSGCDWRSPVILILQFTRKLQTFQSFSSTVDSCNYVYMILPTIKYVCMIMTCRRIVRASKHKVWR